MALPMLKLPVIRLDADEHDRAQEISKLVNSFQEFGFCLVAGVDGYDWKAALALAKWFFYELKEEDKMKLATKSFNERNQNVYRGYFPVQEGNISCKEGFEAGEECDPSDNPLLEPTPFPNVPGKEKECQDFRKGYQNIRKSLTKASDTILKWIALGNGLDEDYFHSMFHDGIPLSTHRIIRYPRRNGNIPQPAILPDGRIISTGAHADSGILTLLDTFGQKGLELELNGKWMPVECNHGMLVVNIGEQLARMCHGKLRATIHRVMDIGKDRISMPFFYEPHCDADMNSRIPLFADDNSGQQELNYVAFASFLLRKLGIYAEYQGLMDTIPDWMKKKYLEAENLDCWAIRTGQTVDGKVQ